MYESGVIEPENGKYIFVCPKCGETRDVSGLRGTIHCCKTREKTKQCYRIKREEFE